MTKTQPRLPFLLAFRLLAAITFAALLFASTPATAMTYIGYTGNATGGVYCTESNGGMQCYLCTGNYGGSLPGAWGGGGVLLGVQLGIPDPAHPGSYSGGYQVGVSAGECP